MHPKAKLFTFVCTKTFGFPLASALGISRSATPSSSTQVLLDNISTLEAFILTVLNRYHSTL